MVSSAHHCGAGCTLVAQASMISETALGSLDQKANGHPSLILFAFIAFDLV
jgi:hypothetical protein